MASNTFTVALTGGIASGKSTVAQLFAELGAPIIDADHISHILTDVDCPTYLAIVDYFGVTILNANRSLNRKKLRAIIFENPLKKQWLENLLHPLIQERMREDISKILAPYCICVIPLLAESQHPRSYDRILVVDTTVEQQLARATLRDHITVDNAQKIIHAQADRNTRNALADDIIINNDDIAALKARVLELHQKYLLLV